MSDTDSWEGMTEQRQQPRLERIFKVVFQTPEDLKEKYTKDISKGGIFVVSSFQPPVDTIVEVQLHIPGRELPIQVTGRVAHVLSDELATEKDAKPGFGVQFIRFFDDDEDLLHDYIEETL